MNSQQLVDCYWLLRQWRNRMKQEKSKSILYGIQKERLDRAITLLVDELIKGWKIAA
jgi:hypothetical protein